MENKPNTTAELNHTLSELRDVTADSEITDYLIYIFYQTKEKETCKFFATQAKHLDFFQYLAKDVEKALEALPDPSDKRTLQ